MRRKYIWIYSFYAAAIAATVLCFVINRLMTNKRHSYTPEDLTGYYAEWGITQGTMKEFTALPPQAPHDTVAAEIGADLFQSRKIGVLRRSCATCHPLNKGGADGLRHSGVFTRPAMNAIFGTAYLHDGSIKDFPSLVKRMVEDDSFAAAGTLSNALERVNIDGRMKKRFIACFGEKGFTGTNIVTAIVNYSRTLMTANGLFDRFCGGRDSLSPEQMKGFEQFRRRGCAHCHSGPSLGTRVVTDKGKRVPSLRGLSKRRTYQGDGNMYSDLAAAVAMMPNSDFDGDEENRLALLAFLRCL